MCRRAPQACAAGARRAKARLLAAQACAERAPAIGLLPPQALMTPVEVTTSWAQERPWRPKVQSQHEARIEKAQGTSHLQNQGLLHLLKYFDPNLPVVNLS